MIQFYGNFERDNYFNYQIQIINERTSANLEAGKDNLFLIKILTD